MFPAVNNNTSAHTTTCAVNRRKCRVHYCAGLHYQSGRKNKHKASFDEVDSLIMSPFTQNHTGHYKQKRDRQQKAALWSSVG